MSKSNKVAVVVGSLRKDSFNRKLASALMELAPDSLDCDFVEIGGLSFFNQDLEKNPPADWTDFRAKIKAHDAVLFVSPEYNRSIPGALKNAIDVGSRPYGHSVWEGKPAAVVTASPGATGGFGSNHHIRQALVFLDMPTMQMPEAYIGKVDSLLDEKGNVSSEGTRKFLTKIMATFADWVAQNAKS